MKSLTGNSSKGDGVDFTVSPSADKSLALCDCILNQSEVLIEGISTTLPTYASVCYSQARLHGFVQFFPCSWFKGP